MRRLYTTILLLFILTSCQSQVSKVDNTKPLYGEVEKNKEQKEIDKDFEIALQLGDQNVIQLIKENCEK